MGFGFTIDFDLRPQGTAQKTEMEGIVRLFPIVVANPVESVLEGAEMCIFGGMESNDQQPSPRQLWTFQGIRMGHALSTYENYGVHKAHNDHDTVRLHFGLRGDYAFAYEQLGQSFDLAGGHHNIMYSKGLDLEIRNKTLEIETFGVDFPKESFIQFTEGSDPLLMPFIELMLEGKPALLSPVWGTVDSKIQGVIDEIMLNPYQGPLHEVFLLAKSLELLVLCVANYTRINAADYQYVKSKADQERIIAARDFINERLTDPPNLPEVAKAVGLNEFKLKHGFKEVFHSTVFGYLTERRLVRAKQMLLDTQLTAAEISTELGYSSPQHFSRQFRNRFGTAPNMIRKNP